MSVLLTYAPYHLLACVTSIHTLHSQHWQSTSYGTLLGVEVFQSFIGGIVAYRTLPRAQFSSLQQAIFPIYFSLQTAVPVVLALTLPGSDAVFNPIRGGLSGLLAEDNRSSILLPLTTIFATSLMNLGIFGPATTRILRERKHQGTYWTFCLQRNASRLWILAFTSWKELFSEMSDLWVTNHLDDRDEGREKELRQSAPFQRNDEIKQDLWVDAWNLVIAQFGWAFCDCMVWRQPRGENQIGTSTSFGIANSSKLMYISPHETRNDNTASELRRCINHLC